MWTTMDSPVGPLRLVVHQDAVSAIEFSASDPRTSPRRSQTNTTPATSARSSMAWAAAAATGRPVGDRDDGDPLLREVVAQLRGYFDGSLKEFQLPVAPSGTPFQQRVWEQLCGLGYGETATYGEIARRLGMTAAASRAVGLANGRNPVPIVVPCHRVVGADGTLTGYAGGIERKQFLLDLEQGALF